MPTRPRLARSIPFWGLLLVSLATIAGGWFLTNRTLGSMTTTLTDGTATGVDVYVGQSIAQLGAVLIGAGVVGVLLALTVAALSTLRPRPVEGAEQPAWTADERDAAAPAVAAPATAEPAVASPAAEPAVAPTPAAADAAAEPAVAPTPAAADAAAPVSSESPDIEVASDTPAPVAASSERPDPAR
ncbi:dinucleotide-utilizing enzyme [Microbacterium atlanticum]|uniref:dinucleotide-utilizing enzyme n=1 Tax=Microbacterium atlanticum TaxID=2782168 RepID=UPI001889A0A7|nr:dinucleotide-utilizing enzyme [Microbacterium atlanticum]